jgi:hypothetical protein
MSLATECAKCTLRWLEANTSSLPPVMRAIPDRKLRIFRELPEFGYATNVMNRTRGD